MDSIASASTAPTLRLHAPHGKSTRFQVRKLYDRLHQEVVSHMEDGNSEVAATLVHSRRAEVNHTDETGLSLLMSACCHDNLTVVKALLEEGADVNAYDNDCWTPLMYACRDGRLEVVIELLDAEADMERRDAGSWTALMWACYKGHTACVDVLINRGANINIKAMHNMTCLHWAAGRGYFEIVDLLLRNDAKVDATDKYGSTPLIWASRKGYLNIVKALLDMSASADAVGMYSWTPLLVSLQGGHTEVAKVLLTTLPNLNVTDKAGMTALALAAKAGYNDIVIELLQQGAYLNVVDKDGDTVLHHAVKGCHVDIVKMLIRKNPDIDAKGQDGKTVLYLAVEKGNSAVVRVILGTDPDKEITDKDGNTPLLRAVRNRNCEMAYLLVEKGARVAAADSKGNTSLHIAIRARNRKMLELLLKNPRHSRYLYIRNQAGETPYSIDGGSKRSMLAHLFGARSLNSQDAVESQLGYELYSSALADILSSPTLNTPMTVGLFAKWGSGKSFMLNKLKDDMKAYMRQSTRVYFEFSWLVFFINFAFCALLGLVLAGALTNWKIGLPVGCALFLALYIMQGILYCLDQKKNWDWVAFISHAIAKKIQKLRLLLYMLFYTRPPTPPDDAVCNTISFVFAESTKLTSLGGEQSLSTMIGSLFDALEKKYGTCVTRLYKVFGSEKERKGAFKKICCIPYFVIVLFVIFCFVAAVGLIWSHPNIQTNSDPINIVMGVLAGIVALSLLLSLHNIGRAIAAYAYSPKRRTSKASQALDVSKSDNFLHVLKNEVEFLSSLVTTMDRHEKWQTRLVLIIDGLDSCEQEKVLQVLDAINLIIPENSPFIILLALDPHVIIKGIEANQLQAMHDPSLNGYGYLRNIVHLPFYLQNHGLPRMHTTNETAQLKKWQQNGQAKQKMTLDKQASVMSSTLSLEQHQPNRSQRRRGSVNADSMMTMEPLSLFTGDMPKNIVKNDYFVDINPRSMRRLLNIIAMAGRLLRANEMDFNWYRLSSWINITEQWPYRTSWILLYYEEMEGKLDDNLSLLSIYDIVKERMPLHREAEPLLDIDRNEKKFIAFLKSHVPKLNVDDIKKFMSSTINLDPFLRKIIKEKMRDQELNNTEVGRLHVASPSTFYPQPRFPQVPQQPFYPNLAHPLFPPHVRPVAPQRSTQCHVKIPKGAKPLSKCAVSDICDLLHNIKGLSVLNMDAYKTAILLHNINGTVLADCELSELKIVLEMKFGDWQLFQSTILAMREADGMVSPSSSGSDLSNNVFSRAKLPDQDAVEFINTSANSSSSSVANSPYHNRRPSLKLKAAPFHRVDTSTDTVRMENQMIMNAVQSLVPGSDLEEESPDEDPPTLTQNAVTTALLGPSKAADSSPKPGDDNVTGRFVTFSVIDEYKENAVTLLNGTSSYDTESQVTHPDDVELTDMTDGSITFNVKPSLPVIAESSPESRHQEDKEILGAHNAAFESD